MRLHTAFTRRVLSVVNRLGVDVARLGAAAAASQIDAPGNVNADTEKRAASSGSDRLEEGDKLAVGVTSSYQDNIVISNAWIMRVRGKNGKVFVCEFVPMQR